MRDEGKQPRDYYEARIACTDSSKTREAVARLRAEGLSYNAISRRLDITKSTVAYHARRLGVPVDDREWIIPIDELLAVGRKRSRGHLKNRLIREGLKENRCEECGITEWGGKPLNMELHHVNGDGQDNRLENLQLLCGNCHAQTENWGGRGRRRKRGRQTC